MEIKNYFAQDAQGNIMPSANCYLYLPGTTTLATGLVDGNGTPISNPFLASSIGQVEFGAPNGVYDLRVALGARDWTIKVQCADIVQAMDVMDSILGPHAENPTTRNNGQPLELGDETWNSTDKQPYWWDGSSWLAMDESSRQLEAKLANPTFGASLSAWNRSSVRPVTDVASALDSLRVSIWELAHLADGYTKGGDPQAWDWAPAFNALNGKAGWAPPYIYPVKRGVVWDTPGTDIQFGGSSSAIIKAVSGFVGDCVVTVGKRSTPTVIRSAFVRDMGIDCSSITGVYGYSMWGCRDGSGMAGVYVFNCDKENFVFGQAGGGLGAATGLMNQGLVINNCHGINTTKPFIGDRVWLLDGLFETTLVGCKALGASSIENAVSGFDVGFETESRAVWLEGCSSGNLRHSTDANNAGIRYGKWADNCQDDRHTFEGISGSAVIYHGNLVSGRARPAYCRSTNPRLYASTAAGVMDIAFDFGDAAGCRVEPVDYWTPAKVAVRFRATATPGAQFNNRAVVNTTLDVSSSGDLACVVFEPGTSASAIVTGLASSTTERKEFVICPSKVYRKIYPNGAQIGGDTFWTTIRSGASDKIRLQSNAGANLLELDGAIPQITPQARLFVGQAWDSASKITIGSYRLWVDAFGRTRSKNGEPTSATDGFPFGQKVAVPSTATSSGSPGAWAASSTFFYVYVGDGSTHSWVRSALAAW